MVFCTFVYKMGGFGGHEVNGFVDVCAPTNILGAWIEKNPCMETRQNVPPNIIYLPHKRKYQNYERNIDKNTKGYCFLSSAHGEEGVDIGCGILGGRRWCFSVWC